jgi:YcaO-like protein with predicted kinase domain
MTTAAGQESRQSGPLALKRFRAGTHRITPPQETLERVRRFFPVLGITRVADVTGLDTIGIPVIMVYRPNSRSIVVSQGKALNLPAAKASGVMESVEAFMAERIVLPLKLGSFNDLRFSHLLADVEALPLRTTTLYTRDSPILWIEGQELISGQRMWIPYESVHTAYTLPAPTGTGCFVASSNGLASGNHFLEALSHAICETVERDAATLHNVRASENRSLRLIDPGTVDDPDCLEALGRLGRAGLTVHIWNITSDVGIAAFKCSIAGADRGLPRLKYDFVGMGCHPDRGIALLRALTEAAQSRLACIAGARDEVTRADYSAATAPESRPHGAAAAQPGGDFLAVPTFDAESFDADVAWEVGALRQAGLSQVIAVDLTREEFGIPVVRVVIPGLEGPTETVPSCRLGQRARDVIGAQ